MCISDSVLFESELSWPEIFSVEVAIRFRVVERGGCGEPEPALLCSSVLVAQRWCTGLGLGWAL